MEKKQAKTAFDRNALAAGSIDQGNNKDSSWILDDKYVTTQELTKISTEMSWKGKTATMEFFGERSDSNETSLFREESGLCGGSVLKGGGEDEPELRRMVAHPLTGLYFLYRPDRPVFEGQEADDHVVKGEDKDKERKYYLYGRVWTFPATTDKTTDFAIYSVVTGPDADASETGMGSSWRDVYKVVKLKQFQFAALVYEIHPRNRAEDPSSDYPLVAKVRQEGAMRVRPKFEVAKGVDLPSVAAACVPLLPDGSNVVAGIEAVVDEVSWWI